MVLDEPPIHVLSFLDFRLCTDPSVIPATVRHRAAQRSSTGYWISPRRGTTNVVFEKSISYLLTRNVRAEEDIFDHRSNSSENS